MQLKLVSTEFTGRACIYATEQCQRTQRCTRQGESSVESRVSQTSPHLVGEWVAWPITIALQSRLMQHPAYSALCVSTLSVDIPYYSQSKGYFVSQRVKSLSIGEERAGMLGQRVMPNPLQCISSNASAAVISCRNTSKTVLFE